MYKLLKNIPPRNPSTTQRTRLKSIHKCAICGKFRKWEDLKHYIEYEWDGYGDNIVEDEFYECVKCKTK